MLKRPGGPSEGSRFDTIDLLRGFSILGVLLLHIRIYCNVVRHPIGRSLPAWLYHAVFYNGGNGVSAFFAISGFLITYISIRRFGSLKQVAPLGFYRIRFARIAPMLLLFLAVLSVLHMANVTGFHIKPAMGTLPQALFAALTFQLNWFEAVHGWLPPAWTVLWTLSVEEMFYLFFPLLCFLLLRFRWGTAAYISVLAGLIIVGPVARTPLYTHNAIWSYQSYLGNTDNIAMGCLTAMLADRLIRSGPTIRLRWIRMLKTSGALLMFFIVVWDWPKTILGWRVKYALGHTGTDVTVLGVGTCMVMLASVVRPAAGWRLTAPIRWLGRYSYEVYLTHEFAVIAVLAAFARMRHGPIAAWAFAVVLASGALGFVVARLFSEPMNRVLRGTHTRTLIPLSALDGAEAAGLDRRRQPASGSRRAFRLSGRFLVQRGSQNGAHHDFDKRTQRCVHGQMAREEVRDVHKADVGNQGSDDPDGQAGVDRCLHARAEARPDRDVNP
jgi:peptidoglycan/LPS O-acetylase OafA/YrhL